MHWQNPHDESAKAIAILSVEPDDTTDTYVIGDWVLWKLTDDSATAGGPDTRGYRVERAPANDAANVAGVVKRLPDPNGTASNLAATRRLKPFEVQCWGFFDGARVDVTVNSFPGDPLAMSAVAGVAEENAAPDGAEYVGFLMDIATAASGVETLAVFVKCV